MLRLLEESGSGGKLWFMDGTFPTPTCLSKQHIIPLKHIERSWQKTSLWVITRKEQDLSGGDLHPQVYTKSTEMLLWTKAGRMGIGIIVRDSEGKVYAVASQSLSALLEPVVTKAIAALKAVEFSRNRGLYKIILEGDSLQVVNAVNAAGPNCSTYGQIMANIQAVLHTL